MVNRPFRVAFWALAVNLGLSLCLLMSDPGVLRLALHGGPAPRAGTDRDGTSPLQMAAASPQSSAATSAEADSPHTVSPEIQSGPAPVLQPEPPQHEVPVADTGTEAPATGRIFAEMPPLPVREVSANEDSGYPWILHDASRTICGTGRFEELPPPPEFADDLPPAESTPQSAEFDRETATQLAGLGERLDDLHGELAELRTSHTAVERTLTELAALSESAVAAARVAESPLEIRAIVMQAPLTGELHDGVLAALHRSGVAGDISVESESWNGVAWSVTHCTTGLISSWLQRTTSTGRMAQRTIRLMPGEAGFLDLWRLLPPRMIQARGSFVFERAPRPAWGGALELRQPENETGGVDLEFRTSAAGNPATETSSDWRQATIPEGGTLIVTGQSGEPTRHRSDEDERALPHEQLVGGSEIVVILAPRRISPDRADHEAAPEPARLLPTIDAPELPVAPE